jgi:hypothetical protein
MKIQRLDVPPTTVTIQIARSTVSAKPFAAAIRSHPDLFPRWA